MKRVASIVAAAGGAFALSACVPPHPHAQAPLRAISRLDCPNEEGDLTVKSIAGDGASCAYGDAHGDEVAVSLVRLNGADPQTVLKPIETLLETEMPAASSKAASSHTPTEHDNVDIDVPGVHIHASQNGDAKVQAPGATVTASANGDAEVNTKGVSINANESGAQVRVNESGPGTRSFFLLKADSPGPHGYKVVGYDASGPDSGPIVIAQFKGKGGGDFDDLQDDVKRLVKRNTGG